MTFLRMTRHPTDAYRAKTNEMLYLDHRHKHCACGARITDKQKNQQDGCCSKCFAEKKVKP